MSDYIKGIFAFQPDTPESRNWLESEVYLLKGIDGLTLIKDDLLIGIQNNSTPKKVIGISFSDNKVDRVNLLDSDYPILVSRPMDSFKRKKAFFTLPIVNGLCMILRGIP